MSAELHERLNSIYPKVTSPEFLTHKGLGNEIGFHIFDYIPEDELEIRQYIELLEKKLKTHHEIKMASINMLEFLIEYMKDRRIYENALSSETGKGAKYVKKALEAALKPEKLRSYLTTKYSPDEYNLFLIHGVGNCWPFIRAHSLLNNLQAYLGNSSLLLFYPGTYDGQHFKLFGRLASSPYYRAFRLI